PQQNFVGILIDDSRSMSLTDPGGVPRGDFVSASFGPEQGELAEALPERFVLRYFRFSYLARRVAGLGALRLEGTRADRGGARDGAREVVAGVPLSGLVLVTVGADTGNRPITEALVPLQAGGVPVFTVGLGEEVISPDIEVGRV